MSYMLPYVRYPGQTDVKKKNTRVWATKMISRHWDLQPR